MKLTKEQKSDLKQVKATWIKDYNVRFISVPDVVTIAWYRPFHGSKMIMVSTSYYDQNEADRFRGKTGEYFAALRLTKAMPECMQLPLGDLPEYVVEEILLNKFTI